MKIATVEPIILRVPLQERTFYSSQAKFPERNSLLVKITTEDGIVGWGEGGQYGPPGPVAACIDNVLSPLVVGSSACSPVVMSERLYAYSRDFGQSGTYIEAISAIDIALWDIWGKILGQPAYALMGGAFRNKVITYATGCYYPDQPWSMPEILSDLEVEARSYVESGFDILKIKVGLLSVEDDLKRVETLRRCVGDKIKLLVDANHAYSSATAIRMGKALGDFGVHFLEEPVTPEDLTGYKRVRDAIDIPVAGGECAFTRYDFRDLFVGQCIDIAQPDICVCGGFSEFQKILAMAGTFGVLTIPHVWGSGIAVAAAMQALAVIPPTPYTANPIALQNEPAVEFDCTHNPLRDDLLEEKFTRQDGCVTVPTGPGLGVTVNEEVLNRYRTTL